MWLTRVSVKNPYFATVLMLALVVLGAFSWYRLPVEEFPDIRFPVAVVITEYRGASPSVVETEVSRPVEEAVNTINGVKHIRSYSMANSAQARKRARQALKQRSHNASLRTAFRSAVKKVIKAVEAGDKAAAREVFQASVKVIDRIADKGVFHKNKAARHKSRLSSQIKAMAA